MKDEKAQVKSAEEAWRNLPREKGDLMRTKVSEESDAPPPPKRSLLGTRGREVVGRKRVDSAPGFALGEARGAERYPWDHGGTAFTPVGVGIALEPHPKELNSCFPASAAPGWGGENLAQARLS